MQAKQCHYRATENMQKKKKKEKLQSAVGVQKRNYPFRGLFGRDET